MVPNMNPAQLVSHYDAASNGPINYISLLSSIQIGFAVTCTQGLQ
jgi:hypothetical protein